ncbi:MAG: hypothetical protein JNK47_02800 [Mesorhizobium sp.]|nr:hypothetical protein [Mesorhizobium sp.]
MGSAAPSRERIADASKQLPGLDAHSVQQILYIEDACRSAPSSIEELKAAGQPGRAVLSDEQTALLDALRNDMHFLRSLAGEKDFLRPKGMR